jgi:hypothetical protein
MAQSLYKENRTNASLAGKREEKYLPTTVIETCSIL